MTSSCRIIRPISRLTIEIMESEEEDDNEELKELLHLLIVDIIEQPDSKSDGEIMD